MATMAMETIEILIQDDASPEYDLTRLPLPPPIIPQRNEVNLGFAGNVNTAAYRARGEWLVILNQDTRALPYHDDPPIIKQLLTPGWLDRLLEFAESKPDAGIIAPRLLFPNGAIQSAGGLFDVGKGPYHRMLGWTNPLDHRLTLPERVAWTTGAAIMIRKVDFDELGGFRGDIYPGGYFEDVHLCMEVVHTLKKEVWYCPHASMIHEVGSTGGSVSFKKNALTFHKIWDDKIIPDTFVRMVEY